MQVMSAMIEEDRIRLCTPRHARFQIATHLA
jgi:hypothetical protein